MGVKGVKSVGLVVWYVSGQEFISPSAPTIALEFFICDVCRVQDAVKSFFCSLNHDFIYTTEMWGERELKCQLIPALVVAS